MTAEQNDKAQPYQTNFDLSTLYAIIQERQRFPQHDSYTSQLFRMGEDEIAKKIGEEAIEVILACKSQGRQRLIEETADLTYHVLVMLAMKNITLTDIQIELERRHR
jgi:phosphoribosyl-ATP pyrophosphohydrolase